MKTWVIVATLNRSEELMKYTLSSLTKQNNDVDFEVIVCDASDNNQTKRVIDSVNGLKITYYKAPRKGLALQRNDSIGFIKERAQRDDIVIFLDDDVVLSNDAISGVIETFNTFGCSGVGIPIINQKKDSNILKVVLKLVFLNFVYKKRHMTRYCYQYKPWNEKNGDVVNWLSGCGMAYRFYCFDSISFEEKLNRFGGYCLGEDALFSFLIHQKYGSLRLASYGNLQHMKSPSSRINYENLVASNIYNRKLIFKQINKNACWLKYVLLKICFFWNSSYIRASLWLKSLRNHSHKAFAIGSKKGRREK